jgi:RNA polymerase sigma-70 factor (ECF subfamily)
LEALGTLFDRHHEAVFRTALAITDDEEMAADLVQEVFLRLHRYAERVDATRPLRPWLYRVTVNLAYSWLKRRQRLWRLVKELAERLVGEWHRGPHAQVERKEEWEQVRRAIGRLPLPQRVVIVLYYLDDLPIHEISTILNVPEGTVKSRLHYGRRALRRALMPKTGMLGEILAEILPEGEYGSS